MKNLAAIVICMSFVPAASAAVRVDAVVIGSDRVSSSRGLSTEISMGADGSRALARLSRCRENVHDWPQSCDDEVLFTLPGLAVDLKSRTITLNSEVVARWSRLGRFMRLEPSFRLSHEVAVESDAAGFNRNEVKRARLFLERVRS